MIRLLAILIGAGLVALCAVWVADHDINLTLMVASYEIRTTAAVAAILLTLSFVALWLILRVLFAILMGFARARGGRPRRDKTERVPTVPPDSVPREF